VDDWAVILPAAFTPMADIQVRQRNLWVTETFEWRLEARLAQPANPMPE
jgi:hypothetical protein